MLPHLFEVSQTWSNSVNNGTYPSKCSNLQRFAAVKRIPIFYQPNIVFGHFGNEITSNIDLAKGQLVVIFII